LNLFLDCPHAPSAQELVESTHPEGTVWGDLARNRGGKSLVALSKRGARLVAGKAWEEAMKAAQPDVIEPLIKLLKEPIPEKMTGRILKAWEERLRANDLSPAQMTMASSLLQPNAPALTEGQAEIQQQLATGWGSRPNGSKARAYSFCPNYGAKKLVEEGNISKGPMAGHWNVLAACVMARIRSAQTVGAHEWDAHRMIGMDFQDSASHGLLKGAIGQEWRKGISLDGVLALGLLGQALDESELTMGNLKSHQERILNDEVPDFSAVAGISDGMAWVRASAPDAAEFTCAVLKTINANAAACLLYTWRRALTVYPEFVEKVTPDLRRRLVSALHARFELDPKGDQRERRLAFEGVVETLLEDFAGKSLQRGNLSTEEDLHLAIELALVKPPLSQQSLEALGNHHHRFTPATWDTLDAWTRIEEKHWPEKAAKHGPVLRQWKLDQTLPSPKPNLSKGPRF